MHKLTKSFFQEAIFILTCQGGNSAKVKIIEIPRLTQGLLVNIYKGESQFQIICKYMYQFLFQERLYQFLFQERYQYVFKNRKFFLKNAIEITIQYCLMRNIYNINNIATQWNLFCNLRSPLGQTHSTTYIKNFFLRFRPNMKNPKKKISIYLKSILT